MGIHMINLAVAKRHKPQITPLFYPVWDDVLSIGLYPSSAYDYDYCHDAAEGQATSGPDGLALNHYYTAYDRYYIYRSFFSFNTFKIPNGATILSAVLHMQLKSKVENDIGQSDLYVVEGVQHSPPILTDYGAHVAKVASGGSIAYADLPLVGEFFDIPLNKTGRGWINKHGDTKFCVRLNGDRLDHEPTDLNGVEFNVHGLLGEEWDAVPCLEVTWFC